MFPKYQEKDIVIFEQTNDYTIANKKDCAVMVNGFDATFKNITINEFGITLVPLNLNNTDNYQPTFYNKEQIEQLPVRIIGIAREKRTKL
jgi:SOS-response transcriptional repressor LexA